MIAAGRAQQHGGRGEAAAAVGLQPLATHGFVQAKALFAGERDDCAHRELDGDRCHFDPGPGRQLTQCKPDAAGTAPRRATCRGRQGPLSLCYEPTILCGGVMTPRQNWIAVAWTPHPGMTEPNDELADATAALLRELLRTLDAFAWAQRRLHPPWAGRLVEALDPCSATPLDVALAPHQRAGMAGAGARRRRAPRVGGRPRSRRARSVRGGGLRSDSGHGPLPRGTPSSAGGGNPLPPVAGAPSGQPLLPRGGRPRRRVVDRAAAGRGRPRAQVATSRRESGRRSESSTTTTTVANAAVCRSTFPSTGIRRRAGRWWWRSTAAAATAPTSSGPGCARRAAADVSCWRRPPSTTPGRC